VTKSFLASLIRHLNTHGRVLTEHIGLEQCEKEGVTDKFIYERDMGWLRSSDVVVAECSSASLGVGYELGFADSLRKPTLCLYRWPREDGKHLSAMIAGNERNILQTVAQYKDEADATQIIDKWLHKIKSEAGAVATRILHVVSWHLLAQDEEGRAAATAEVKSTLEGLVGVIPGLLDLTVSRNAVPDLAGGQDIALVAHYSSAQALRDYVIHPAHQAAVLIVRKHTKDRTCIDLAC